jgi:hypothetical protein
MFAAGGWAIWLYISEMGAQGAQRASIRSHHHHQLLLTNLPLQVLGSSPLPERA